MTNVLITGASGFIGSFLVEEGLKRNLTVYAGIRKTSSRKYLTDRGIRFVEFDFSITASLESTLLELKSQKVHFNYIIHCAGITKSQKKDDFNRVNYLNTRNFIEALINTEMVPSKFIFLSSLAAFGPGDPVTMEPVMLSGIPKPIEIYGKSKLAAETFITSLKDFPWLIFRPTGVYGPRETDYYVFFRTINNGLEPYIGTKKQILTFIYVKDLARLVFDALASPVVNKAYFVSDGLEYESVTFAAITKKHLNKKTFQFTIPAGIVKVIAYSLEKVCGLWGTTPTLNSDKYNVLSSTNWRCEIAPLQNDFNFKADYDLDSGVKETLEWYKKEGWF